MPLSKEDKRAIDTIRMLSAECIEKAASGHPGLPMGTADFAYTLWSKHLKHNPEHPEWIGRDRFILSAGHGSMLLYSLLHLFGYGLTIEDLRGFRQYETLTPGHPEFGHTKGVEVTTGPLGSGFGASIGIAIASKMLNSATNGVFSELLDNKVYSLMGDGCNMEGVSSEAASLAGHLKLGNVIAYYDSNNITIDGSTDLSFTEDVAARYKAYGWGVIETDGHDTDELSKAIEWAKNDTEKPSLIIGKSKIGFGSPNKEGTAASHGAPLGKDELLLTRENLGFDKEGEFEAPEDVKKVYSAHVENLKKQYRDWTAKMDKLRAENPEEAKILDSYFKKEILSDMKKYLLEKSGNKAAATRASGGETIQAIAARIPNFVGGSADLNAPTKTYIKNGGDFFPPEYKGKNIFYGVREFAMGVITNGLALHGGFIPYCSTFMVFLDYMKAAVRLASIMKLKAFFIYTHDSIYVGEDGPTHQPVEQLAMLRSIPGLTVFRPADSAETAACYAAALNIDGPSAFCLTRQKLEPLGIEEPMPEKGAYAVNDCDSPDLLIIASGSEVKLALETAKELESSGKKARVISMPSWEMFDLAPAEYRESVLPASVKKRVVIEAGISMGWQKYSGDEGLILGVDEFGKSGPYKTVGKEFGFCTESVIIRINEKYGI